MCRSSLLNRCLCESVFGLLAGNSLLIVWCVWSPLGEHAIDAGGPFREVMTHMAQELNSSRVDLFVPTPNSLHMAGATKGQVKSPFFLNRGVDCAHVGGRMAFPAFLLAYCCCFVSSDCHFCLQFYPNPARVDERSLDLFRFAGLLMAFGVVNNCPFPLSFSPIFFKKLAREDVSVEDYCRHVDNLEWMQSLGSAVGTLWHPSVQPFRSIPLHPLSFLCMCLSAFLWLYTCVCVCVGVCVSVRVSVRVYACVYMCVSAFVWLRMYLCV